MSETLKPEPRTRRSERQVIESDVAGTVVKWKSDRGYGFIRTEQGRDVFCHVKALYGYPVIQGLAVETKVIFDVVAGDKGPAASRVRSIVPP